MKHILYEENSREYNIVLVYNEGYILKIATARKSSNVISFELLFFHLETSGKEQ